MSLRKEIRSVTYLKSRAADLIAELNRSKRAVVITQNGEPRAVLQDPESYERMRDALVLLKLVALGEADVRAGRVRRQQDVFTRIQRRLDKQKAAHARHA